MATDCVKDSAKEYSWICVLSETRGTLIFRSSHGRIWLFLVILNFQTITFNIVDTHFNFFKGGDMIQGYFSSQFIKIDWLWLDSTLKMDHIIIFRYLYLISPMEEIALNGEIFVYLLTLHYLFTNSCHLHINTKYLYTPCTIDFRFWDTINARTKNKHSYY